MKSMTFGKIVIATILAMISSVCLAFTAGSNMPTTPAGWTLKEASTNVRIYQKNGEDTYVQMIDIQNGGKVRLHGTIVGYQTVNGYNEPVFQKKNLATHWATIPYAGKRAVTNGQFFDPNPALTSSKLAFATRVNGSYLTYGSDMYSSGSVGAKRTLHIFGNSVSTRVYLASDFAGASSSQAIVGFDSAVNRNAPLPIGRTFLCGVNRPYISAPGAPAPQLQEWLLILTAKNKLQYGVVNSELASWNCQSGNIVMSDGGGSSQLQTLSGIIMYGHTSSSLGIKPDNRLLPHVIVTTDYWSRLIVIPTQGDYSPCFFNKFQIMPKNLIKLTFLTIAFFLLMNMRSDDIFSQFFHLSTFREALTQWWGNISYLWDILSYIYMVCLLIGIPLCILLGCIYLVYHSNIWIRSISIFYALFFVAFLAIPSLRYTTIGWEYTLNNITDIGPRWSSTETMPTIPTGTRFILRDCDLHPDDQRICIPVFWNDQYGSFMLYGHADNEYYRLPRDPRRWYARIFF